MKKILSILLLSLSFLSVYAQEQVDDRFFNGQDSNDLQTTEYNRIFEIKPHINKKNIIENYDEYTLRVINKRDGTFVAEFDNVVDHWQGMSGWEGRVVAEDYTFLTSDYKQYIVKASRYDIEIEMANSILPPKKETRDPLKTENLILKIVILVLAVSFIITLIIILIFRNRNKGLPTPEQILKIQEEEKAKISREIHDTIVQDIRAIRLETDLITTDDMEHKNRVIEDITKCIIKMRNICYNLTPAELVSHEDGDSSQIELISIIDTLCQQFSVKTKIVCSLQIEKNLEYPSFSKEVSTNVVRVFQEILTNIEKHSYATKTTVLVRSKEENNQKYLLIFVIDDGIGCEIDEFKSKKMKKHFGIRNMQERMHEIDGGIEFFSAPDEGMKVVLTIKA